MIYIRRITVFLLCVIFSIDYTASLPRSYQGYLRPAATALNQETARALESAAMPAPDLSEREDALISYGVYSQDELLRIKSLYGRFSQTSGLTQFSSYERVFIWQYMILMHLDKIKPELFGDIENDILKLQDALEIDGLYIGYEWGGYTLSTGEEHFGGLSPKDKVETIARSMRIRPGEKILDLGCGDGRVIINFAQGYRRALFVGIDASAYNISKAMDRIISMGKRAPGNVRFHLRDFRPPAPKPADPGEYIPNRGMPDKYRGITFDAVFLLEGVMDSYEYKGNWMPLVWQQAVNVVNKDGGKILFFGLRGRELLSNALPEGTEAKSQPNTPFYIDGRPSHHFYPYWGRDPDNPYKLESASFYVWRIGPKEDEPEIGEGSILFGRTSQDSEADSGRPRQLRLFDDDGNPKTPKTASTGNTGSTPEQLFDFLLRWEPRIEAPEIALTWGANFNPDDYNSFLDYVDGLDYIDSHLKRSITLKLLLNIIITGLFIDNKLALKTLSDLILLDDNEKSMRAHAEQFRIAYHPPDDMPIAITSSLAIIRRDVSSRGYDLNAINDFMYRAGFLIRPHGAERGPRNNTPKTSATGGYGYQDVEYCARPVNGKRPVFLILGMPGSGKDTLADMLAETLGLARVSTGNVVRQRRRGNPNFDPGLLKRPGYVYEGMLRDYIVSNNVAGGIVLDDSPRTAYSVSSLARMLRGLGFWISAIIYIDVDEGTARERIAARAEVADRKWEVSKEVVDKRIRLHRKNVPRQIERWSKNRDLVFSVSGEEAARVVLERVMGFLKETDKVYSVPYGGVTVADSGPLLMDIDAAEDPLEVLIAIASAA